MMYYTYIIHLFYLDSQIFFTFFGDVFQYFYTFFGVVYEYIFTFFGDNFNFLYYDNKLYIKKIIYIQKSNLISNVLSLLKITSLTNSFK